MVLSIDGRKSTFAYDAEYWKNKKTYNYELEGKPPFEHKSKAYYRVPFNEINVLMLTGKKSMKNLVIKRKSKSLYHLLADGKYKPTRFGRKRWKKLIDNSSLQKNCNREGFNVYNRLMRVRIGIIANQENNCDTPDSRLGIGAGSNDKARGPNRSVGNEAIGYQPDRGKRKTTAWGFILVR